MSGTVQIGRAGSDISWDTPESVSFDGDKVSLAGAFSCASLADATALRDQIRGLVDNVDEPVVPFIWSEDSTLDGFVRVTDAKVSTVQASYTAYWFNYSISCERVAAGALPAVTSRHVVALRASDYAESGTLTSYGWGVAIPASTPYAYADWGGGTVNAYSGAAYTSDVAGSIGTLTYMGPGTVYSTGTISTGVSSWAATPDTWYHGACRCEYGSVVVTGRQLPGTIPGSVLISNGLDRLYSTNGTIYLQSQTSGTWATARKYVTGYNGGTYATSTLAAQLVSNSPHETVAKFVLGVSARGGVPMSLDVRMRRGAYAAEFVLTAPTSAGVLSVKRVDSTPGTALVIPGGGTYCGVYGFDGITPEWGIATSANYSTITNAGVQTTTSATIMPFAICDGSDAQNTFPGDYFTVIGNVDRVVSR